MPRKNWFPITISDDYIELHGKPKVGHRIPMTEPNTGKAAELVLRKHVKGSEWLGEGFYTDQSQARH